MRAEQDRQASRALNPPEFNAHHDVDKVMPVDEASWRLEWSGLIVDRQAWTVRQIDALPQRTEIINHTRVEGWDHVGQRSGVPLRTFLERVGTDLRANYVASRTADDYPGSIDMAIALHPQTLLATRHAGGTPADPFGYPLPLRMSTRPGCKSPKRITAIAATETFPRTGYREKSGYSWFAGILTISVL